MTETRTEARRTVMVSELTDGILDPAKPMLGPVTSGGTIVGNTGPGVLGANDHAKNSRRSRSDPPGICGWSDAG